MIMTFVKYTGTDTISVNLDTQHAQGNMVTVSTGDILNISFKEFFLTNRDLLRTDRHIATLAEIAAEINSSS